MHRYYCICGYWTDEPDIWASHLMLDKYDHYEQQRGPICFEETMVEGIMEHCEMAEAVALTVGEIGSLTAETLASLLNRIVVLEQKVKVLESHECTGSTGDSED